MDKLDEYKKASEIADRLGITTSEALNEFEKLFAESMRDEQEWNDEFYM